MEAAAGAATDGAGRSGGLRVGFLGCGVIASSIARGLARAAIEPGSNDAVRIESILLSRRSESRSGPLAEELAEKGNGAFGVSIEGDNQEILERSDLVFLTVLPRQAGAVLEGLEFDPQRHVLVSLVSTAKLEDLVRDSKLAPSRVSKMICLPSIAQHRGVALLCCGSESGDGGGGSSTQTNTGAFLKGLFGAMGGCVALDTEADLEACMVTTCTMGPLYGTMKKQRDWLLATCTGSLSREDATFLVIKQFAGAVAEAETATTKSESEGGENGLSDKLEELIAEQTPGGLNEQALRNYGEVLGGFEDLQQPVMDAILGRIRGETDGNLGAP